MHGFLLTLAERYSGARDFTMSADDIAIRMAIGHKKKGRLRCHKRPKSREETPKEGSDSGVGGRYRIPLA
jgi:hypothetical protein